jgi:hypothetical protein
VSTDEAGTEDDGDDDAGDDDDSDDNDNDDAGCGMDDSVSPAACDDAS